MTRLQDIRNFLALLKLEKQAAWKPPLSTVMNNTLHASQMSPVDRSRVEEHITKQPRFFFRAWSDLSGGPRSLNSKQEIRPAFFHDKTQRSIHDFPRSCMNFYQVPKQILELHAGLHLEGFRSCNEKDVQEFSVNEWMSLACVRGKNFSTYFSSWSQSLSWALSLYHRTPEGLHISVLDTAHPSFDKGNTPILSVKRLSDLVAANKHNPKQQPPSSASQEPETSRFAHEFLAFGPIHAPAFSTVPYADLCEAGLAEMFTRRPGDASDYSGKTHQALAEISKVLPLAKACGRLFDHGFDLPVMAHLLGVCHEGPGDHDKVVAGLSTESVNECLRDLPAVIPDNIDYEGHIEALRGDQILRDVVIGRFGGYAASTVEERSLAEKRREPEKKHAAESIIKDKRTTDEAKRDYLDVTGLDEKIED